jgi:hypothetical protein
MIQFLLSHWVALSSGLGALGLAGGTAAWFLIPGAAAFMGPIFKAIGEWFSRRSLAEIVCMLLACALVFALLRADHWKAVATTRQQELVKCDHDKADLKQQLDSISSKRNEQKVITQTRIVTVTKLVKVADDKAKVIEQAPLPKGNDPQKCQTPDAVAKESGL